MVVKKGSVKKGMTKKTAARKEAAILPAEEGIEPVTMATGTTEVVEVAGVPLENNKKSAAAPLPSIVYESYFRCENCDKDLTREGNYLRVDFRTCPKCKQPMRTVQGRHQSL